MVAVFITNFIVFLLQTWKVDLKHIYAYCIVKYYNNPLSFLVLCLAEIRAQLVEQLKCLDQQCELRVQLLQDLQDFFRKKAEIEMDYSRNLEKLAERFLAKTRYTKDPQYK